LGFLGLRHSAWAELSDEVIAGTLGEAATACWAEVLAAESVAFENMVVALENWVAASQMDDADPTLVGESSAVL
jgi:hypothetical protein